MKSIIRFLFNIWYAQSYARDLEKSDGRLFELILRHNRVLDENAALRSQISQRDASGRFAKKNAL